MSRIGKKPVKVPSGVKVEVTPQLLKVSGAKDTLTLDLDGAVSVSQEGDEVVVTRKDDSRHARAMHGTIRSHIANMIEGVTKGFQRGLSIYGTGYSVKVQGQNLEVAVGFAKPVVMPIPAGINVEIKTPAARGNDNPAQFIISGPSKHLVGQFAAAIRLKKPPEPYLGKGIRYTDEQIKRKVGKAFGSS